MTTTISSDAFAGVCVAEAIGEHKATIVFLHGLGDDGDGWLEQFECMRRKRNNALKHVKIICPSAISRPISRHNGMKMNAWYDIPSYDKFDRNQDERGVKQTCQAIAQILEEEHTKYAIPYEKIVLGGFSQGGSVALYGSLTSLEHKIGAILALSTYIPLAYLLQADLKEANISTPIFMAHGNADTVVDLETAKKSYAIIAKAKWDKFKASSDIEEDFHEYENMDHSFTSAVENDVVDFLIKLL